MVYKELSQNFCSFFPQSKTARLISKEEEEKRRLRGCTIAAVFSGDGTVRIQLSVRTVPSLMGCAPKGQGRRNIPRL